ncbi:MAG: hypothetical protein M1483_04660 [Actinobacteria bacterium]|nr:hypothetical protein [Actinomycetota bacterium]MCL6104904.1 hypothetical protein [Actinomycetota bacterium]
MATGSPSKSALVGTLPQSAKVRKTAQTILKEPQFRSHTPPRPLHGLLSTIGHWLDFKLPSFPHPFGSNIFSNMLWTMLILAVISAVILGFAIVLTHRLTSKAVRVKRLEDKTPTIPAKTDYLNPDELLRQAILAENSSQFNEAVKLRFKAGIVRLEKDGYVTNTLTTTTEDISETIASPTFNYLAKTFNEIAYANKTADIQDMLEARSGWVMVLKEVSDTVYAVSSSK